MEEELEGPKKHDVDVDDDVVDVEDEIFDVGGMKKKEKEKKEKKNRRMFSTFQRRIEDQRR